MIDWRTLLHAPVPSQNSQNPQNGDAEGNSANIANIARSTSEQETAATSLAAESPASPLPRHCFVTYTDRLGRLCGGWEERATSTVKRCHGTGQSCEVELSDGRRIPLRSIRAVGQTNEEGRLLAAWTVRDCGFSTA